MNYLNQDFLQQHCQEILDFYTPRVVDIKGGYFQNYYDDGSLFAQGEKQLVSSTRIIVNYALAAIIFKNDDYLTIAKHGLDFLETVHWQEDTKNYAWTLTDNKPNDMTQQAYGYAFVLLAYAAVKKAGIINSDEKLLETFELLEHRFWQSDYGLYADEISPDSCRLWDIETGKKLDTDVFRRDLGDLADAYTEVAKRLGVLPSNVTHAATKPTLIN